MSGWPWYHHVANFLFFLIWMVPYNVLLKPRFSRWLTALFDMLMFAVYYLTVMLLTPVYSWARLLIGEAIILCVPLFFHRGKLHTKLLIWVVSFVISLVSDMTAFMLTDTTGLPASAIRPQDYPILGYAVSMLIHVILFTVLVLTGFGIRRQEVRELRLPEALSFSLYPLCHVLLLFYWLRYLWTDFTRFGAYQAGFVLLFSMFTILCLFLFIRAASSASTLRAKVTLLEEEAQQQDHYYAALAEDYAKAVAMRAELHRQDERFAKLIAQGRHDDALRSVEAYSSAQLAPGTFPLCENRTVASFLEHRLEELTASGIRAVFSVSMPADVGISDPDLICLFGNLLDNAAEACAKLPDAEVSLLCDWQAPYLRVRMDNSAPLNAPRRKKRIAELDRGIGFHILSQLAEKHDGEWVTSQKGGWFHSSMTLKGGESDAENRNL